MIVKYYYMDNYRIAIIRNSDSFWIGYPYEEFDNQGYQSTNNKISSYSRRWSLPSNLFNMDLYSGFVAIQSTRQGIKWRPIETDNN